MLEKLCYNLSVRHSEMCGSSWNTYRFVEFPGISHRVEISNVLCYSSIPFTRANTPCLVEALIGERYFKRHPHFTIADDKVAKIAELKRRLLRSKTGVKRHIDMSWYGDECRLYADCLKE